jgi:hypothetical protein
MDNGDIIGIILVYVYVILLLVISEKVIKNIPISVENSCILWWGTFYSYYPCSNHDGSWPFW